MIVTVGSVTHKGMERSSNEDFYCALTGPNGLLGADALLAVADGMGGHQAGEVASAMTILGLADRLRSSIEKDKPITNRQMPEVLLDQIVREVNTEVYRASASSETEGMGTTLTVALLVGGQATIAHVGDTRAYHARGRQIQRLTQDHTLAGEALARGIVDDEHVKDFIGQSVLTRALGRSPSIKVDTLTINLNLGDAVVICSDGLYSLVSDSEIAKAVANNEPQKACEHLVGQANDRGGHDNITVIVARIVEITPIPH